MTRVLITGATGNVGTSVLQALATDDAITDITALARRYPSHGFSEAEFISADVVHSDLVPLLRGANVVIHLAWAIQPGRDGALTHTVNVLGSERLFKAVVEAKVPSLIYASSVGAYSPGPKDREVDETWPTNGIASSFYSRHKVTVERLLDRLEAEQPHLRVVRMRPGLIFKAQAATEIRRLFFGPLIPDVVLRRRLVPLVPNVRDLRFQAVHSTDVGDAYRRAALSDASGAFNLAAAPSLGPADLARALDAHEVRLPAGVLRGAAAATFKLHLQPSEPGWLDLALKVPLMDAARARRELGWSPAHNAIDTLQELIAGIGRGADFDTPPLSRVSSGPGRINEFRTGLGSRP